MKYIFSLALLVSYHSFLVSMQEMQPVVARDEFDDEKPFTPQAVKKYGLPAALLNALEKPIRSENYSDNLKNVQQICLYLHSYLNSSAKNLNFQLKYLESSDPAFTCPLRQVTLGNIDKLADREDWTPHKAKCVVKDCFAVTKRLLQERLAQCTTDSDSRTILEKKTS